MFHVRGRTRRSSAGLVAASLALALLATQARIVRAEGIALTETGSTLMYPLFKLWIADYPHVAPDVTVTPAATGSGMGVSSAIGGTTTIGASDAYMSDRQAEQNPGIAEIPLAIAAQMVNYNIPGLNNAGLKLDGPTLAGIYSGRITSWDAPEIAELNPGVKLPHQPIVPIRRSDPSGDTFIFTQFLDFSTQTWEDRIGYGDTVNWPQVPAGRAVQGNQGMLETVAATPFSVAYIGISFRDAAAKAGLGMAMLKNENGKFVLPSADTINAAAAELDPRTPADERLTLVFAPGDTSYPLVNYEYAVVSTRQANAETAAALRQFLRWTIALQGGNAPKYLDAVGFVPLPDFIRALSENQIARIK